MAQSPKTHINTMQLISRMSSFNTKFSIAFYSLPEVSTPLNYHYVQKALDAMDEFSQFAQTHIHDLSLSPEPSVHTTMLVTYLIKHTRHLKLKIISKISSYPDNDINFIIRFC